MILMNEPLKMRFIFIEMSTELTTEQRAVIVDRIHSGQSQRQVAAALGVSRGAVERAISIHRTTGGFESLPRSGRPRSTTDRDDRILVRMSLTNRRLTAPDIRKSLSNDYGVHVSARTVQNRLLDVGLYGRIARRKPLISEKNRVARLTWAREHVNWSDGQWENVLWSDESKFNLFGSDGQILVRRRAGEEMNPACVVPTVKHGGGCIMVWASMSAQGTGPIRLVEGIMNQHQYRCILEETMLPAAETIFANRRWIFQHDNDPKHTARSVKQWIDEKGIENMWWPAQSPDLNPIEHLWNEVDYSVKSSRPSSKAELFQVVSEAWGNIPANRCRTLVESMGRRCQAVIVSKGGPTKY